MGEEAGGVCLYSMPARGVTSHLAVWLHFASSIHYSGIFRHMAVSPRLPRTLSSFHYLSQMIRPTRKLVEPMGVISIKNSTKCTKTLGLWAEVAGESTGRHPNQATVRYGRFIYSHTQIDSLALSDQVDR